MWKKAVEYDRIKNNTRIVTRFISTTQSPFYLRMRDLSILSSINLYIITIKRNSSRKILLQTTNKQRYKGLHIFPFLTAMRYNETAHSEWPEWWFFTSFLKMGRSNVNIGYLFKRLHIHARADCWAVQKMWWKLINVVVPLSHKF